MNRLVLILPLCVVVAGCAVPNVSKEIDGFGKAVDTAAEPMQKSLTEQVDRQRAVTVQAAIAENETIYPSPLSCRRIADGILDDMPLSCRDTPLPELSIARGTPAYAQLGLKVVQDYGSILAGLSGTNSPALIKTNLDGFLTGLNAFEAARTGAADATLVSTARIAPLAGLAGQLAEAARGRAIRRLVNDAHIPLREVLDELIAYHAKADGLGSAMTALNASYIAMENAQATGNPHVYRRAVARYETALATFKSRAGKSHTVRLLLIWKQQELLLTAVNKPGDVEAYLSIIESIKDLSEAE